MQKIGPYINMQLKKREHHPAPDILGPHLVIHWYGGNSKELRLIKN